ncbi:hypothetical protein [Paroceanicella profunda]|uniref:hypothetical protein n=1 Tax=Paroceanicella profunda TaxID=2579971 RepID=UPI0014783CF0|nr:hypothetical protein [Paroceanicella profunda]
MQFGEHSAQVSQLIFEASVHAHNGADDAAATEHDTLTRMRAEIARHRADLQAQA